MDNIQDRLKDIAEIRSLMEQSTKFLSLSGLSGIFAGLYALAGAFVAWLYLGKYEAMFNKMMGIQGFSRRYYSDDAYEYEGLSAIPDSIPVDGITQADLSYLNPDNYAPGNLKVWGLNLETFFFLDAGLVLGLALFTAWFVSRRMARKRSLPFWNKAAKNTLINLSIPLVTGGLFCMILVMHGDLLSVSGATLLFYGLALINASKYTLKEIRYLGLSEIALGLMATLWPGYGLYFWALGFGVLHIVYGTFLYLKYER